MIWNSFKKNKYETKVSFPFQILWNVSEIELERSGQQQQQQQPEKKRRRR